MKGSTVKKSKITIRQKLLENMLFEDLSLYCNSKIDPKDQLNREIEKIKERLSELKDSINKDDI